MDIVKIEKEGGYYDPLTFHIEYKKNDRIRRGSIQYARNYYNCKLAYIDCISIIGTLLYYNLEENKIKELLNKILNHDKQVEIVMLNTTNELIKKFIVDNMNVLSLSSIPIGYSENEYQHHFILKNSTYYYDYSEMYERRIREEGISGFFKKAE